MSKDGRIWLSHTSIELMIRCPRCFWFQTKKKIRQPEGIVSRLANRFDIVLKNYFNAYRQKGVLPPLVEDDLPGVLESPFQESYFVRISPTYGFFGKLDECLIDNRLHIPVDFKTSSSDPREHDTLPAYQSQIDDYIFLLEKSGKETKKIGYLVYFFPDMGQVLHEKFPMVVHVAQLVGDPTRTEKRIEAAITLLDGPMPNSSAECPFCSWREKMNTLDKPVSEQAPSDIQEELF